MVNPEKEPVCDILVESERAGIQLMLERPLRVAELLRAMRLISHLAETREILCRRSQREST